MNPSPIHHFEWDLISGSFLGTLSKEEVFQLQQWLDSDPQHQEKYRQLQEIWHNGLEEYELYLMANETKAWNALQPKLEHKGQSKVINLNKDHSYRKTFQFATIAAILAILIGVGYWYLSIRHDATIYETAFNEQKTFQLTDGSAITLNQATKIEVSPYYGTKNRTLTMTSGEASFDVKHRDDLPFIVELGRVTVKDIGTVFKVKKEKERIRVTVISGTVALKKQSSNETPELTAGMSLTYNILNDNIEEIQTDTHAPKADDGLLNFDNTALTDVIVLIQKQFGKTIRLEGDSIANKKFTAHLGDMPCETVLDVICKSLNLEYSLKDNIYILREKTDK